MPTLSSYMQKLGFPIIAALQAPKPVPEIILTPPSPAIPLSLTIDSIGDALNYGITSSQSMADIMVPSSPATVATSKEVARVTAFQEDDDSCPTIMVVPPTPIIFSPLPDNMFRAASPMDAGPSLPAGVSSSSRRVGSTYKPSSSGLVENMVNLRPSSVPRILPSAELSDDGYMSDDEGNDDDLASLSDVISQFPAVPSKSRGLTMKPLAQLMKDAANHSPSPSTRRASKFAHVPFRSRPRVQAMTPVKALSSDNGVKKSRPLPPIPTHAIPMRPLPIHKTNSSTPSLPPTYPPAPIQSRPDPTTDKKHSLLSNPILTTFLFLYNIVMLARLDSSGVRMGSGPPPSHAPPAAPAAPEMARELSESAKIVEELRAKWREEEATRQRKADKEERLRKRRQRAAVVAGDEKRALTEKLRQSRLADKRAIARVFSPPLPPLREDRQLEDECEREEMLERMRPVQSPSPSPDFAFFLPLPQLQNEEKVEGSVTSPSGSGMSAWIPRDLFDGQSFGMAGDILLR
ncbi:hypothetical protein FA15DRAFT_753332 [Coprinopsis marcescibilis]|uniref:Uncharacterized protein n=1 Tax=Coprinopsis marcescibilis TaxID=230819 RepID=A0A5C3L6J2_COPMA|nr:hypothetical protein FA15DRAFT_753332 [Coprinopsis marcescibilis]